MTVLVLIETALLVVLTVLVAGLLRAYATVLQRLHQLDGGAHGPSEFSVAPSSAAAPNPAAAQSPAPAPILEPERREQWAGAHDITGETLTGEVVASRVLGVDHDTVLVFLSSGCTSCQVFWDEFARPGAVQLPARTRLMVVTQGTEADSRAALRAAAPAGLDVVLSSAAWSEYEVPGSPYVVLVDGQTGRIRGEGTGQSWRQVRELLAQSSGDAAFLTGGPSSQKPKADSGREADADRELLAAGILPGDARLYQDGA